MYPVTICALVVMGNHLHMLLVVEDPESVPRFIEFFKRESAHAINRLLGRSKHTVWCNGYDSPVILDANKVMQRLVYFYTNPQRARLVSVIEDYPHYTTWSNFISGETSTQLVPVFPRHAIPRLSKGDGSASSEESERVYQQLLHESVGGAELEIVPFAWLNVLSSGGSQHSVILSVTNRVRAIEQSLLERKGVEVEGADALINQDIRKPHQPRMRGKRMICLGSDPRKRSKYIEWFLRESRMAHRNILEWMGRRAALIIPPGFFAPGGRILANILPCAIFQPT